MCTVQERIITRNVQINNIIYRAFVINLAVCKLYKIMGRREKCDLHGFIFLSFRFTHDVGPSKIIEKEGHRNIGKG